MTKNPRPIVLRERGTKNAPEVAIFPRLVKGLQSEIDTGYTRVFVTLGGRREVTVEGSLADVIGQLWPTDG